MLYPDEASESSAAAYKEGEMNVEQHWAQSTLPRHRHFSETENIGKMGLHAMRTTVESFVSPFSIRKKGHDSFHDSNVGVAMKNFKKETRDSSEGRASIGGGMEAVPLDGFYEGKMSSFFPKREVHDNKMDETNRSTARKFAAVDYPCSGSFLPSYSFRTPSPSSTHSQSPLPPLYTRRSDAYPILEPSSTLLPSRHTKQSDAYSFLLRQYEEKNNEMQRLYEQNKQLQHHMWLDRRYFAQYGHLFFLAQEAGMRRELQWEEKKIRAEIQIHLFQSIISSMGVDLLASHATTCGKRRVEPSPDCRNPNLPFASPFFSPSLCHLVGEKSIRRVESAVTEKSMNSAVSFPPDGLHGSDDLHKPSLGSSASPNVQENGTVAPHSHCLSSPTTVPTPYAKAFSPSVHSSADRTSAWFSSMCREELSAGLSSSPSLSQRDETDSFRNDAYEDGVIVVEKKRTSFSPDCLPLAASSSSTSECPLKCSVSHSATSAHTCSSYTSIHQDSMPKNSVPTASSPLKDTNNSYHFKDLSHSHQNCSDSNREKGKVSELTSTVKALEERIRGLSTALSNEAKLTKDMQEEIDDLILQELILVEESARANIEKTYAEKFMDISQEENRALKQNERRKG